MLHCEGVFVQQGGGGPVFPDFTYTGEYYIVNEGTPDWKIYFTSSGTFTPASNIAVQVQAIGGGSGGNGGNCSDGLGSGGGGGKNSVKEIILEADKDYSITIGAGGSGGSASGAGKNGGTTSGFGVSGAGGSPGVRVNVFEFRETSAIRQSGYGGDGGYANDGYADGHNGQNAGDSDPNIGGGLGGSGNGLQSGGNGNFGSIGGKGKNYGNSYAGGGGGGGGYGGGGGGGGTAWYNGYISGGAGGAGAPGVIIMRNTRLAT